MTGQQQRYEFAFWPHRWIPFLYRAVVIDTASPGGRAVVRRLGFGRDRMAARISRDLDRVSAAS